MIDFLKDKLLEYKFIGGLKSGSGQLWSSILAYALTIAFILLIIAIVHILLKRVVVKAIKALVIKSKFKWDDALIEHKVLDRAIKIAPVLIIYFFAPVFPEVQVWIERLASALLILGVLYTLFALLDSLDTIYNKQEVARQRPIKGLLQVVKIILTIMC